MDVKLAIFNACSAQPSYSWLTVCHRTLELYSKTNSPRRRLLLQARKRLLLQANKIWEWENREAFQPLSGTAVWKVSLVC